MVTSSILYSGLGIRCLQLLSNPAWGCSRFDHQSIALLESFETADLNLNDGSLTFLTAIWATVHSPCSQMGSVFRFVWKQPLRDFDHCLCLISYYLPEATMAILCQLPTRTISVRTERVAWENREERSRGIPLVIHIKIATSHWVIVKQWEDFDTIRGYS